MVAVVWPAGFCLSIFSTGIMRFWQLCLISLDELLVNQIEWPATALQAMLPVCTTLSKITSHRLGLLPGFVKKLKLVVSGLDAGKFLIVQLPSIWIWEGGTGLT